MSTRAPDVHTSNTRYCVALLALFPASVGCGSSAPFDYVRIEGTVKYDNGQALPDSVTVRFQVQEVAPVGNAHPRVALAHLEGGRFDVVTSYKYGDGLIPGKHTVFFQDATDDNGNLLVPQEYLRPTTSPLTIDTADSPVAIEIPAPVPRKERRR